MSESLATFIQAMQQLRARLGRLLSSRQVGEELGMSPAAVPVTEKRAIRRLRQHLRGCRSR
ncbi:MAG: hypothetical protein AB1Z22_11260 [Synechococcaceae cyanobacterium]